MAKQKLIEEKAPRDSTAKAREDAQKAAALAALKALGSNEVQRVPAYFDTRVSWLRALVPLVAKDHAGLLDAPLDPALTKAELDMFPALVSIVGDADAQRATEARPAKLTPAEAALLATLRGHQARLDRAFRVRLRGDRAGLRLLAEIRRGEPGDPEDMLADAQRLVKLCDDTKHTAWIAALKKGEPAALAALREALPGLEALANRAAGPQGRRVSRDTLRRAMTLALRVADRAVAAGEYHTSDIAGREGDYKRFKRPTVRKPAKKTP
jgi:hypothetical protein